MRNYLKSFTIMFILTSILIISPQPSSAAYLNVNIGYVPNSEEVGTEFKVYVSANKAAYLYLRVDGTTVGSCGPTYGCYIDFITPSETIWHSIQAVGYYFPSSGGWESDYSPKKWMLGTFYEGGSYFEQSLDFMRTHKIDFTVDLLHEVYEYTHTRVPGDIDSDGLINTRLEKIRAIENFAASIMQPRWTGDDDALTAGETAEVFKYFDGSTDTSNSFSLYALPSRASGQGTRLDCQDMAALISGLASAAGVDNRMISLSDEDDNYNHYFTELYGLSVLSNNGWFLIDPSHSEGYYNSYDQTEVTGVFQGYVQGIDRLWITWGWSGTSSWGSTVVDTDIHNGWSFHPQTLREPNPSPDHILYSSNPWNL